MTDASESEVQISTIDRMTPEQLADLEAAIGPAEPPQVPAGKTPCPDCGKLEIHDADCRASEPVAGKTPGQVVYEAYSLSCYGVLDPLNSWDKLFRMCRKDWEAAARAVQGMGEHQVALVTALKTARAAMAVKYNAKECEAIESAVRLVEPDWNP